jgi:hypothetical protein
MAGHRDVGHTSRLRSNWRRAKNGTYLTNVRTFTELLFAPEKSGEKCRNSPPKVATDQWSALDKILIAVLLAVSVRTSFSSIRTAVEQQKIFVCANCFLEPPVSVRRPLRPLHISFDRYFRLRKLRPPQYVLLPSVSRYASAGSAVGLADPR